MEVTLYSDGSSRGNPGPGGYGTILRYTAPSGAVHEKEFSAGFSCTTNNRMELLGCIVGLEALKGPCTVTVYSDSQYLVNAFNQNWVAGWLKRGWKNSQKQPVKNVDLWKRLLAAKEPHTVKFVWVKGHAGTSAATSSPPPPPTTPPAISKTLVFGGICEDDLLGRLCVWKDAKVVFMDRVSFRIKACIKREDLENVFKWTVF